MVDEKVVTEVITDDDDLDESKKYDAEYVRKLKAEAKEYRQGKAALKKDYEDTKAKLDALEADKLTDTEKKDKRVKELETELLNIQGSVKAKETENLILKAISGKNFIKIDIVTLLIKKELESEEEINDKIIEKIVDKLIKENPFLVSSGNINPSDGNFRKQSNEPVQDVDMLFGKMIRDTKG